MPGPDVSADGDLIPANPREFKPQSVVAGSKRPAGHEPHGRPDVPAGPPTTASAVVPPTPLPVRMGGQVALESSCGYSLNRNRAAWYSDVSRATSSAAGTTAFTAPMP
jgi:hypothetical protein